MNPEFFEGLVLKQSVELRNLHKQFSLLINECALKSMAPYLVIRECKCWRASVKRLTDTWHSKTSESSSYKEIMSDYFGSESDANIYL
jgi:hypothetical protein